MKEYRILEKSKQVGIILLKKKEPAHIFVSKYGYQAGVGSMATLTTDMTIFPKDEDIIIPDGYHFVGKI